MPCSKNSLDPPPAARGDEKENWNERQRPLFWFMVVPLAITALFSIVFCFFPGMFFIMPLAKLAVGSLFGGP